MNGGSEAIVVNGVEFPPGRAISVGRDPSCDVHVDHEKVSRRHGSIEWSESGWTYRDASSSNGSYAGGERVDGVAVTGEMILSLGGANDGARLSLALRPHAPTMPAPPPAAAASELGKLSVVHHVRGERTRIGRDPDNDIVLPDLRVSRHHAELRRDGGETSLVDLSSANGTFVNGSRVERAVLGELDVVAIGNHILRFAGGDLAEYVETGEAWLEASRLTYTTDGGARILDGVGFSLEPSSLLAIVGPSGAGKSTLLGALTGFRPATSGAVLYGGRDVYAYYEDVRRRIGYVPQEDILHPTLTVRNALDYAARLRFPPDVEVAARSARIDEVLHELGLTERADLAVGKLSGGQRKRTSIALELLTKPSLLFLDEPTSGLDPGNEAQVMDQLRILAAGGRIVIVVTHSVSSLEMCDRVLFLAPGGTTAYFGPPSDALAYFARLGVQGYANVFRALEEERSRDWNAAYQRDADYRRYVRTSEALAEARRVRGADRPRPAPRQQSWLRQVAVLSRRYASVIASDRRNLLLLGLQAPIFGLLYSLLFPPNTFSTRAGLAAAMLVWLVVMGATWIGVSNSIREVSKELPIYRRERSVGLSISAYLASKVLVLGAITIVQSAVLAMLALWRQHLPPADPIGVFAFLGRPAPVGGSVIGSMRLELFVVFAAAGLAAMAIGLMMSSMVKTVERAMSLLPLVLIAQLVVSMPTIPQRGALRDAGYVFSAKWGSDAASSTVSENELRLPYYAISYATSRLLLGAEQARKQATKPFRGEWAHTRTAWLTDMGALGGMILFGIAGAWLALLRRDTSILGEAARPG